MSAGRKLLVGVDEAGYGPNLGPLVVAAAAMEVPAGLGSRDLWDHLGPRVSRQPPSQPDQIVIDDSKRVYAAGSGWHSMERTVLAWLRGCGHDSATLRRLCAGLCIDEPADFQTSPWYSGCDLALPGAASSDEVQFAWFELAEALEGADCMGCQCRCQIVMPGEFNRLLEAMSSKSQLLFATVSGLLRHFWSQETAAEIELVVDKHGGRNFYGGLLQGVFAADLVLAGREGRECSHYNIQAHGRRMRIRFVPKGDVDHLLVALASMTAKYLRELCMKLFNDFWQRAVPGLRPTAGYPLDASRFRRDIQPALAGMNLDETLLWRKK